MRMIMRMPTRPMMMMRVPIDYIRLRRRAAPIRQLAPRHLQLNRRMPDAKMILQLMIHPPQQRLGLTH